MSLGPRVIPIMEQLGVLNEILSKSKIMSDNYSWSEDLQLQNIYDYRVIKEENGVCRIYITYSAIRDPPKEEIHSNKRVLSYVETGGGVIVRTSNGTTHFGNILMGADGTHSGVRQSLYERLANENRLSRSDAQPLKFC
ncbi:hypothetical protein BG011_007292 [Mortierella polycephala]|uniref:FAD-binding domain-containing protein n=1 Tax=Mortierella polycephala TaxID=41804 RepID=A0A9P6PTX0_9FUNG|nr:hypothetical protein BG011_007292 [Mortierella polycephala]